MRPNTPKPNLKKLRPLGACDRCKFIYHLDELQWQYDYRGMQLQRTGFRVCSTCYDKPDPQFKPIVLPPDPQSVVNPLPYDYRNSTVDFLSTVGGDHLVTSSGTNLTTEQDGDAMLDDLYD